MRIRQKYGWDPAVQFATPVSERGFSHCGKTRAVFSTVEQRLVQGRARCRQWKSGPSAPRQSSAVEEPALQGRVSRRKISRALAPVVEERPFRAASVVIKISRALAPVVEERPFKAASVVKKISRALTPVVEERPFRAASVVGKLARALAPVVVFLLEIPFFPAAMKRTDPDRSQTATNNRRGYPSSPALRRSPIICSTSSGCHHFSR